MPVIGKFFRILVLCVAAASAAAAELPAPWVELGADGALSVRAPVAPGSACPAVTADGAAVAALPRGAPDSAFPVQICEARVPAATARLAIGRGAPPPPPA